MTDFRGRFVWYELATKDSEAAAAFYREALGWTIKDAGMPGMAYSLVSAGESLVAGVMGLTPDMEAGGAHPMWLGYIAVADVDDCAERITKAGGFVYRPPSDIPGIGRFAIAADPHRAVFAIFKGAGEPPAALPPPDSLGHVGWRELHAGDRETDFAFYTDLFGWTKLDAIPMGEMGTYQIFSSGEKQSGGVMTKMPHTPAPHWAYYFNVDGLDAAMARVSAAGGQNVFGPQQVPGGSWIANCLDPQGVIFAMVSPKR